MEIERKKPNFMAHFVLGIAIMFTAMYSTFSTGGEQVNEEEFKIKALRKEHHPNT